VDDRQALLPEGELTVAAALNAAAERFVYSESARLDAEVLLADALGTTRERLYAAPERALSAAEKTRFQDAVTRRFKREPVAYIVGHRQFRGIDLQLNENTLIPRPETETLIEAALQCLASCDALEPRLLDIGTGSGAIALALADEHPTARIVASEVHPAPLEMARLNAARLGYAERVEFVVSDVYDELPRGARFDVIVSNPPYVTSDALRRLSIDVRGYEPHVALLGGSRGLDLYERIIPGAPEFLEPGGWLAVEIAESKFIDVMQLFVDTGRFEDIDVRNDLGGSPRVVLGREKR
jgi:release factor glutamine methyltransferase